MDNGCTKNSRKEHYTFCDSIISLWSQILWSQTDTLKTTNVYLRNKSCYFFVFMIDMIIQLLILIFSVFQI